MTEQRQERANEMALITLVTQVHEDVKSLNATISAHIHEEPKAIKAMIEASMSEAFPGGDPHGHKIAHMAQIQAAIDKAEFWKMLRDKLATTGLLGLAGLMLSMLWVGAQAYLHKGN